MNARLALFVPNPVAEVSVEEGNSPKFGLFMPL